MEVLNMSNVLYLKRPKKDNSLLISQENKKYNRSMTKAEELFAFMANEGVDMRLMSKALNAELDKSFDALDNIALLENEYV
jgi:hypothetical protein